MTRAVVQRVALPSDVHLAVDRKYSLRDFVDRERAPRLKPRAMVPPWAMYEMAIDRAREIIAGICGDDLAEDPAMIVKMLMVPIARDAVLFEYISGECGQTSTDDAEWARIRETFAYRLLGRYNRQIGPEGGSDE